MLNRLLKSNIAIVGGGEFCKQLLQLLFSDYFKEQRPSILGVADKNVHAEGLLYAAEMGIFTTNDYRDLYNLEDLQVLMELTADVRLGATINITKPRRRDTYHSLVSAPLHPTNDRIHISSLIPENPAGFSDIILNGDQRTR